MRALVLILAAPASAETPLSAEAFAAHVGSDTITYAYSTGTRGTADYGPDGTLLWAFEGEPCFDGIWFARNEEICFAYPDGRLSACWHFFLDGQRLRGTATELGSGSTDPVTIHETGRTDQALACPGPQVGV
ncbi:hypothetical protein L2E76_11580 [Planktothrix agardhii 1811]|uniref:hypothetical protein n=1 Tax=Planktothrix agardhii TaxID=1160 RepID=UPI001F305F9E|nr:hypothetical protein [Planktothrix agardhii]MCF3581158.1 hypothetical protein [Planktothrix agardhii 1811]